MKIPSTNIQHPEKIQTPIFEDTVLLREIIWSLKFGASLELGVWNLEL
jgi:hypothetical protein